MKKKFFFDLEETVIESWDNPLLVNKTKVESFIHENNISEVSIFSAAIWDDNDKVVFERQLKPWIESVFDIKIIDWPSMTDVWDKTAWKGTQFENVTEMISLVGKKRLFEDWCKVHHRGLFCTLLDDSFDDEIIINHSKNVIIQVVNILTLK